MKAIQTRIYVDGHGRTRVKAFTEQRKRTVVPYDHGMDAEGNHKAAMTEHVKRMDAVSNDGWSKGSHRFGGSTEYDPCIYEWTGGVLPNGRDMAWIGVPVLDRSRLMEN